MRKIKQHASKEEMFMEIPKGGIGAELGVAKGCNAIRLLHLTKPKKLYLVDLWSENDGPRWDNGAEITFPVHLIHKQYRDTIKSYEELVRAKFEGTPNIQLCKADFFAWMNDMPDDSLDWIYLDGTHMYDDTLKELEGAHRIVRSGGIIAGHDFQANFGWGFGVVAPVIEYINERKMIMTDISADDEMAHLCSYMCEVIK
jgi:SAM-dependent methyltransferase